MKTRIIIVDDDKISLAFLKGVLSTLYGVDSFLSPIDALEHLKMNKYPVIITDYKMPDLNGFDFIEKALMLCPDAIPILISAYSDFPTKKTDWHFF